MLLTWNADSGPRSVHPILSWAHLARREVGWAISGGDDSDEDGYQPRVGTCGGVACIPPDDQAARAVRVGRGGGVVRDNTWNQGGGGVSPGADFDLRRGVDARGSSVRRGTGLGGLSHGAAAGTAQ